MQTILSSILSVWWFAIVIDGQALFFEYRTLEACQIVQKAYARSLSSNKIVPCQPKGSTNSLINKYDRSGIEDAT